MADDGTDRTVTSFVIRVTREPELPVPVLDVTPSFPARSGQTITISTAASGFVPVVDRHLFVDGVEVSLDGLGRASITAGAPGRIEATLIVTDADGRTATTTRTIAVRDPADRTAPLLSLAVDDASILAAGPVFGAISDPSLDEWKLLLVQNATGVARQLASGRDPVSGALANLSLDSVRSGFYTLRLEASDTLGYHSILERSVEIAPSEHAAAFTVTDAEVSLDGATIALSRSYELGFKDSTGTFGKGWSANWTDLKLDAGPASLPGAALQQGDRVHLSAPDGTRLVFTARFETEMIAGLERLVLHFDGGDGRHTLAFEGPLLTAVNGKAYSTVSGLPYSPFDSSGARLVLTDESGTEWVANGRGTIREIRTGDGNIRVTATGLIGQDGSAVEILTGAAGTISGIALPTGERLLYLYDRDNRLTFAGGSGQSEPTTYGYDDTNQLTAQGGSAPASISWNGDGDLLITPMTAHFDSLANGATAAIPVTAGQALQTSFVLRDSELGSVAGRVYVSITIDGTVDEASVNGLGPISTKLAGGETTYLFLIETAGLQRLSLTPTASGNLNLAIAVAGDIDADGDVGSADLVGFDGAGWDIDGDGDTDADDRSILVANFGYTSNLPPDFDLAAAKTYTDLETRIALLPHASDPEGDPLFFEIVGALHGTAELSPDGYALRFVPDGGFSGEASVMLRVSDGYRWSQTYTVSIDVSDAALTGIDFGARAPDLQRGEHRRYEAYGRFADGGTALLPSSYADYTVLDPLIASMDGSYLRGVEKGSTVLLVGRGDLSAVTVVNVGALSTGDELLRIQGADVYPDAVVIDPGAERQLLLFDPAGENIFESDGGAVGAWVLDGSVAQVTADGRVVGLAPGETLVTVIYHSTEVLVPILVKEPVIGDAVPVDAEGGIVRNTDGYQVGIGAGAFNRQAEVTIKTLSQSDIPLPMLPEEGWTYGAAFELDFDDTPMVMPAQLAIPTSLEAGTEVIFYRIVEIPTADGGTELAYQEVETGAVDENGVARTKSPPRLGVDKSGQYVLFGAGDALHQVGTTVSKQTAELQEQRAMIRAQYKNIPVVADLAVAAFNQFYTWFDGAPTRNMDIVVFNPDSKEFLAARGIDVDDRNRFEIGLVGLNPQSAINKLLPAVTGAAIQFGALDGSTDSEAFVVLTGERLVSTSKAGKVPLPPPYVIFGEVDHVELLNTVRSAKPGELPEIIRFAGGVAVAATVKEDGTLSAEVPRDVDFESFQVVRFDLASYDSGNHSPSAYAKESEKSGSFADVTARYSDTNTLQPTSRNTYVAIQDGIATPDGPVVEVLRGGIDQLAVIHSPEIPEGETAASTPPYLAGRIPIGYLNEDGTPDLTRSAGPDQVVLSSDFSRAYVGLELAGGIAVVDTIFMRQLDVDPEKAGINFIELKNAPDAQIGELLMDPTERFLFAADKRAGKIYVISIDRNSPLKNQHIGTLSLDQAEWGIRGLTVTPDGKEILVTQGDNPLGGREGSLTIYKLPNLDNLIIRALQSREGNDILTRAARQIKIADKDVELEEVFTATKHFGLIASIRNPQAVKVVFAPPGVEGDLRAVVLDAANNDREASLVQFLSIFKRVAGVWSIENSLQFDINGVFDESIHDVSDPMDIVFDSNGMTAYIIGQKRWLQGDIQRDPLISQDGQIYADDLPPGSNIAIVPNIFQAPDHGGLQWDPIAAATRGIPFSWGRDVGTTTDGKYVVMSGGATGQVFIYDPVGFQTVLENTSGNDLHLRPIDDYSNDGELLFGDTPGGFDRTSVNTDIDIRAAYGLFGEVLTTSPEQLANGPIVTGGLARGVAATQGSFIQFDIPTDSAKPEIQLNFTERWDEVASVTVTIAVAGPGAGLFSSDGSEELEALLVKAGFRLLTGQDGTALDGALPVGANRNRIFTKTFSKDDPQFENGVFNQSFTVISGDDWKGRDLTRGQTYWIGAEAQMIDWSEKRTVRAARSFKIDPAEPEGAARYAGVTVLTHGFVAPYFGAPANGNALYNLAMTLAAENDGAVLMYDPTSTLAWGPWTHVNGTTSPTEAKSLFLVPDWEAASAVNDSGFAEAAGDAFAAAIVALENSLSSTLASPFHFIGEGRGAAVNTEIVQRLIARHGSAMGAIHVTTIDPTNTPQPQQKFPLGDYLTAASTILAVGSGASFLLGQPQVAGALFRASSFLDKVYNTVTILGFNSLDYTDFHDPIVTNWKGVGFADNYYQSVTDIKREFSLTPYGSALKTADVNKRLNGLPGFVEDDGDYDLTLAAIGIDVQKYGFSWGTLHQRAIAWYAGTASLATNDLQITKGRTETVWRQASDRYAVIPDEWSFWDIARYYKDEASEFDQNTQSWYRAREDEVQGGKPAYIFNPSGKPSTRGYSQFDQGPWEGIGTGWFYSSLGGGDEFTSAIPKGDREEPTKAHDDNTIENPTGVPIPGVFNGDFDATFRPWYGRAPVFDNWQLQSWYELPGWSFHGGGSGGSADWLQGLMPAGGSGLSADVADLEDIVGSGALTDNDALMKDLVNRMLKAMLGSGIPKSVENGASVSGLGDIATLLGGYLKKVAGTAFSDDNLAKLVYYSIATDEKRLAALAAKSGGAQVAADITKNKDVYAKQLRTLKFNPKAILTSFAKSAAYNLLPRLFSSIQANFFNYHYSLDRGDSLTHNLMEFPDVDTMSIDVRFESHADALIEPGDVQLHVYATGIDGQKFDFFDETTGVNLTADAIFSEFTGGFQRFYLRVPEGIRGKLGTLTIESVAAATLPPVDLSTHFDNIAFGSGLKITDNSGYSDDHTVFFTDRGVNDPREGFLPTLDLAGDDTHKITFYNDQSTAIDITVTVPKNDFLEFVAGDGWTLVGSLPGGPGVTDNGQTATLKATIQSKQTLDLTAFASVSRQFIASLDATAAALLSSTIEISEKPSGGSSTNTQAVDFFYLLDISDDAAGDGRLRLPDTADGQTSSISIDYKGTYDAPDFIDTIFTSALDETGVDYLQGNYDWNWLKKSDETHGIKIDFSPKNVPAGRTSKSPNSGGNAIDGAKVEFKWKGKVIGSVIVEGQASPKQVINYDADGLEQSLKAEIAARVLLGGQTEIGTRLGDVDTLFQEIEQAVRHHLTEFTASTGLAADAVPYVDRADGPINYTLLTHLPTVVRGGVTIRSELNDQEALFAEADEKFQKIIGDLNAISLFLQQPSEANKSALLARDIASGSFDPDFPAGYIVGCLTLLNAMQPDVDALNTLLDKLDVGASDWTDKFAAFGESSQNETSARGAFKAAYTNGLHEEESSRDSWRGAAEDIFTEISALMGRLQVDVDKDGATQQLLDYLGTFRGKISGYSTSAHNAETRQKMAMDSLGSAVETFVSSVQADADAPSLSSTSGFATFDLAIRKDASHSMAGATTLDLLLLMQDHASDVYSTNQLRYLVDELFNARRSGNESIVISIGSILDAIDFNEAELQAEADRFHRMDLRPRGRPYLRSAGYLSALLRTAHIRRAGPDEHQG